MQACRGKLWQLFLRVDAKRRPGIYSELVERALEHSPFARGGASNANGGSGSGNGAGISAATDGGEAAGEAGQQDDESGGSGASPKPQKEGGLLEGVGSLGLPVVEIVADSSSHGRPSLAAAAGPAELLGAAVVATGAAAAASAPQHATFTITSEDIRPLQQGGAAGPVITRAQEGCPPSEPGPQPHQCTPAREVAGWAGSDAARAGWPATPASAASCSSSDGGPSSGDESSGSWRAKDWLGQVWRAGRGLQLMLEGFCLIRDWSSSVLPGV